MFEPLIGVDAGGGGLQLALHQTFGWRVVEQGGEGIPLARD